ncbi:ABC transporter permease [Thiomicrospira sp. ALE5]|uniref:ABC transporter permease n=1 Tax=Thiomicrospira sp. ALE5 TaxID=748650 RepID=UPI0008F05871|nr:FtsX-like permease family protein [Thiomicrospira sp. ALE5]SFR51484.1 putative ABC transport system permease protein [Thiomicrospira sp. ALE5]
MPLINTALRWFWRGIRRGDWLWLWIAVVIASTSVTLVEQVAQTVQKSMLSKAAESLSADLVIRSTRPIESSWQEWAADNQLATSETLSLTTMALHQDQFQMVMLKGVSANYPLRGQLRTQNHKSLNELGDSAVFADPQLAGLLGLELGNQLTLGSRDFIALDWLSDQDVFQATFSQFAPQVILPIEQIDALGLLGPGSRATFELGFSGAAQALDELYLRLVEADEPHWQIIQARAPTPDLERALNTAWLFLDLASLATVLVAGLAILIASQFYLKRWTATLALLRATGATSRRLVSLFALQLTFLALFASGLGILLGLALFYLLTPVLANYFSPLVIAAPGTAMLLGLLSGTLALWTFSWPAFYRAMQVSPLSVLRQDLSPKSALTALLVSLVLLFLLMSLLLNNQLLIWALPSLLIGGALLALLAGLLLWGLVKIQPFTRGWLRVAIAGLTRAPGLVVTQLVAIGLVIFVLLVMSFVRHDLLNAWQATLPADMPDTFVMNIQPDQHEGVARLLAEQNLTAELVPMVRGRLVAKNDQPMRASQFDEPRAKRLLEREANIAVLSAPPDYNRITAQLPDNQWQTDLPGVSIEAEIAELFGLALGDVLTYDLIGETRQYQVRSLREVDWQSFRLNFFFILEPTEQSLPITYITNFQSNLDETATLALRLAINEQFSGVLWVDARAMIHQIRDIMSQAAMAVTLLYMFTLVASLVVVFTATQSTQLARLRTWLLLRTLGAKQADIIKIGLTEFVLIGMLGGLFAASLGQLASMLIAHFWLELSVGFNPWIWLSAIVISALLLLLIGWLTQRHPLRQTPKQLLQALQAD